MDLKTNDQTMFVLHRIQGIRDSFDWASTVDDWIKINWTNRLLISTGDGRSWIYDFSNVKVGEKNRATETLNCKDRKTIKRDPSEFMKLMEDLGLTKPR